MATKPNVRRVGFSSLRFNAAAQRYVGANGRFIGPATVRGIVDRDLQARAERMQRLAGAVEQGRMDVAEWRERMAKEVKALHLAEVAAAKGGFHRMGAADYGRAGAAIKKQYRYLDNFAGEVAAEPELMSREGVPGRLDFRDRVGQYAEAGRGTYEQVRHNEHQAAGFKTQENVQHSQTPCTGHGSCTEETGKGRVPIGTLSMPGFRICATQCRCEIRYYRQ